jgi:hypothetical protein
MWLVRFTGCSVPGQEQKFPDEVMMFIVLDITEDKQ